MSATIDFYFDFASPYAYFLARPLQELAHRHGRDLRLHPVLLWAVLKQVGLPPPMDCEAKRNYLLLDMKRSAQFHGVDYRHPDVLPLSSHLPARVYYHLLAQGDCALANRFVHQAFAAYFTANQALSDPQCIIAVGAALGIDRATVESGMTATAAKDRLRDATAEAAARGVWGSPFVFIDGEPFFGADRLPQMAAKLERGQEGR